MSLKKIENRVEIFDWHRIINIVIVCGTIKCYNYGCKHLEVTNIAAESCLTKRHDRNANGARIRFYDGSYRVRPALAGETRRYHCIRDPAQKRRYTCASGNFGQRHETNWRADWTLGTCWSNQHFRDTLRTTSINRPAHSANFMRSLGRVHLNSRCRNNSQRPRESLARGVVAIVDTPRRTRRLRSLSRVSRVFRGREQVPGDGFWGNKAFVCVKAKISLPLCILEYEQRRSEHIHKLFRILVMKLPCQLIFVIDYKIQTVSLFVFILNLIW